MIKRPICLIAIGLIFGIIGGQYLNISIVLLFLIYIFLSLGITFFLMKKEERVFLRRMGNKMLKKKIVIFLLLGSIAFGGIYSLWDKQEKYSWKLDEKEVSFIGTILEKEQSDKQMIYQTEIEVLNGKELNRKIKVNLVINQNPEEMFSYGSRIFGKGIWNDFNVARNERWI